MHISNCINVIAVYLKDKLLNSYCPSYSEYMKDTKPIFIDTVDELATVVEEGARANKGNVKRFIEPAEGTLRRALSKGHHIIFGRRGSGKSSLLYKAADDLAVKGNPVALVDLEPFKGHHYPDIIISVLLATLAKFSEWLKIKITSDEGIRVWYTLFILKSYSEKTKSFILLKKRIDSHLTELLEQLHLTDKANLKKVLIDHVSENLSTSSKVAAKTELTSAELAITEAFSKSKNSELQEEFKRNKKEYLLRKILDYQQTFVELYKIGNNDSYLFLDDLYHINRKDQADLIDYFHKIGKGNNLWIKIATIRNRTTWYNHSPQPIGVKIGDDAEEINLDLTLEKFSTTRDFLRSILDRYVKDTNSPKLGEIITDGGLDRLVLSSGGVTRDFLGLFRRSIDEARERIKRSDGEHHRGDRIGAEDANVAAGNYGDVKREEFQRDTPEDRLELENAFNKIKKFCLEITKMNVFLVDQDDTSHDDDLTKELIDLRLLHQIKSRVTVSANPGKIYRALLLDVSQYTGERARRDVEMMDFWRDSEKDKLRRAKLIYESSLDYEVEKQVRKQKDNQTNKTKKDEINNSQMDLGL